MRVAFEKRLAQLEKRVAAKAEETKVCNCRSITHFYNVACLDAILKGIPRICPVHGFRDLGTLFSKPKPYPLRKEDNPFCPCPPHPWRSFQLSGGPNIWERRHAAEKA